MEIWQKCVARFYYARGAEHRPNTEFMWGPLSACNFPPLMEHERPTWKLSDALVPTLKF